MRNSFDPTPPAGWFARARYTPLGDALRGALTARLDPRQVIAAGNLPEPLPTLIYAVVRHSRLRRNARLHVTRELVHDFSRQLAEGRTAVEIAGSFGVPERAASLIRQTIRTKPRRKSAAPVDHDELLIVALPAPVTGVIETVVRRSRLWRSERLDVASELAAHFRDGLAAGRSAEQLAAAFGSPEQAAQLIRQAKIRNRPLVWHAARFLVRAAALSIVAAFVLYGLLAMRMFSGAPDISHDYLREMNAERKAPANEMAWPLYREAIIKLGDPSALNGNPRVDPEWTEAGPQGAHWSELVAAVERYQDSIRLTREGAQKPHLGYLLGNPEDRAAYITAGATWLEREVPASFADNRALIETTLHGIQWMRELARLLQADARVAAAAGDGERTVADIIALLSMSQHLNQPRSFLVEQLVSLAIFNLALSDLGVVLDDSPQIFSDAQLRELAHRIAAHRGGMMTLDFSSELMVFDDLLQRVYTDDGHGDGRLTLEGLEYLQNGILHSTAAANNQEDLALQLMAPGIIAIVAGRAETRELAHKFVNDNIAAHQSLPWQWDADKIYAGDRWLKGTSGNVLERFRYMLPMLLLPATTHVFNAAERAIQQRDAAEAAIALVLWQRRHGAWPAAIEDLVPDLLPSVPPDRFDGAPLRYVVRDGLPVLYSLGVDRDDDGGQPTKQPDQAIPGVYGPRTAEQMGAQSPDCDGDWILWPPLPPPKPAPDPLAPPAGDETNEG